GDPVLVREQASDTDLGCLLAGAEVRRPVHEALQEERLDELLEPADDEHPPVEVEVERGLLGRLDLGHLTLVSMSTRSAPRTYVRPVTSSSSAGNLVRISQPSAVTSTSSSIRADGCE